MTSLDLHEFFKCPIYQYDQVLRCTGARPSTSELERHDPRTIDSLGRQWYLRFHPVGDLRVTQGTSVDRAHTLAQPGGRGLDEDPQEPGPQH